MNLTPLRRQHRQLRDMIHANGQAHVGQVTRIILNGLDDDARRYLRRIEKALRCPVEGPYGTLGEFGENGCAPAIRDIIRQAKWHRESPVVPIPVIHPVSIRPREAA